MKIVLATLLAFFGGYFPSRAIFGKGAIATIAAPLVSAVLCVVAVCASIVARTPLQPALLVAFVPAWLFSAWFLHRKTDLPIVGVTGAQAAWLFVFTLPPLMTLRVAPVAWDARSIWWFHAEWFLAGGAFTREAMASAAFGFETHPGYPPLSSATVAAAWALTGDSSMRTAQVIATVLTLSAVLLLACSVLLVHRRAHGWFPGLAAGALALSAFGLAAGGGTSGEVDLLSAASLGVGVTLLFRTDNARLTLLLGTLGLGVAALTKVEGTLAAVVVLVLVAIKYRHHLTVLRLPATAVAAGLMWTALAAAVGAPSEMRENRIADALRLSSSVVSRAESVLLAWIHWLSPLVLVGILLSVLALAAGNHPAVRRARSVTFWLWLAILASLVPPGLGYILGPYDIGWHLSTSISRTTVAPRLLLLVLVTNWVIAASETWRQPPRPVITDSASRLDGASRQTGATPQEP